MFSVAIFGANKVDAGAVLPGERVVALAAFGGIEMDFASTPPPPAVELLVIAIFGGVNLRVRPEQEVRISGFSLFGGRNVEPRRQLPPPKGPETDAESDDDLQLPLEVAAYAFFGGVAVKREEAEPSNAPACG